MPAPAVTVGVYVAVSAGTVLAVLAFKEFVYDPHIAPKVQEWRAGFVARQNARRQRRGRTSMASVSSTTTLTTAAQDMRDELGSETGTTLGDDPNGTDVELSSLNSWRGATAETSNLRHRLGGGRLASGRDGSVITDGQSNSVETGSIGTARVMDEAISNLPHEPLIPTPVIFSPSSGPATNPWNDSTSSLGLGLTSPAPASSISFSSSSTTLMSPDIRVSRSSTTDRDSITSLPIGRQNDLDHPLGSPRIISPSPSMAPSTSSNTFASALSSQRQSTTDLNHPLPPLPSSSSPHPLQYPSSPPSLSHIAYSLRSESPFSDALSLALSRDGMGSPFSFAGSSHRGDGETASETGTMVTASDGEGDGVFSVRSVSMSSMNDEHTTTITNATATAAVAESHAVGDDTVTTIHLDGDDNSSDDGSDGSWEELSTRGGLGAHGMSPN
ncbi:hypothetical protein BD410DRAFT_834337 [Rickenella mellea]|uniref:Uncharacterized protein n=1 Tax=Rickenella mellea TaxID=50990 RepID=A0A4R5XHM3_9AGAM|nr:hypothetical protein BD410DRAFT_834337 [Rickenella mellea]